MKNLISRIKRRLIIKNRYFIKAAPVRNSDILSDINIIFKGQDALTKMENSCSRIFHGFNSDTSVLIKVNLNSALDYPASVSLEFLDSVIRMLKNSGVKKILIADCTALSRLPTSKVIKNSGIRKFKSKGVKIKSFDAGPWKNVVIKGQFFKNIILPKAIYDYDIIINLANLKTHRFAGFTSASKNLVGFMHPFQRYELHQTNIEERIAEIPLAIIPDLNIIDARKVFISGGPDYGESYNANTIIVDSNLLRADISAYNTLVASQKAAGINGLKPDYKDNITLKSMIEIQEHIE